MKKFWNTITILCLLLYVAGEFVTKSVTPNRMRWSYVLVVLAFGLLIARIVWVAVNYTRP